MKRILKSFFQDGTFNCYIVFENNKFVKSWSYDGEPFDEQGVFEITMHGTKEYLKVKYAYNYFPLYYPIDGNIVSTISTNSVEDYL